VDGLHDWAMLAFAAFWPGTWRWLMWTAVAWSTPAALAILYGQDSSLWLMFAAIGLFLNGAEEAVERRRRVLAVHLQVPPRGGDSHPAGGAETLEDSDRRGHSYRGAACLLLLD